MEDNQEGEMQNATALAVVGPSELDRPRTAADVRAGINLIQEVMKSCMQKGTHYGLVPGCGDKPTLLKAGAEKIMATFRIGVEPEIVDCSDGIIIRYRVRARGFTPSGLTVGWGVGECSSGEEKYAWRSAKCPAEFAATSENDRRIKFGYNGEQTHQVRTNPADVANTVLKVAKKRAQVDLCLTVVGASDIFTQDVEDMPEEVLNRHPAQAAPASRPQALKPANPTQRATTGVTTPAAARPAPAAPPTKPAPRPAAPPPPPAPVAQDEPGTNDGPVDNFDMPPPVENGVAILDVTFRTGKSSKGEWKLFIVKTSGGDYSTFDEDIANRLLAAKDTGVLVAIDASTQIVKMKNGEEVERRNIVAIAGA